jgi:hypothetical protein
MNFVSKYGLLLCVLLWALLASASLRAEIPMTSYWEQIAELSKTRLFVETYGSSKNPVSTSWDDFTRLSKLAELIVQGTGPPDLAGALKAALPTAEVSAVERLGLRVFARDMPDTRKKLLEKKVEVAAFTGPASELLAGLQLKEYKAILNRTFCAPGFAPNFTKLDFKLDQFSFTGSFRDLLITLSTREGKNGSYFVWIDESRCIVRFFPIGGTW